MAPKTELSEKHWKALKLFEEAEMLRKDVAAACGWKVDYLNDLIEGNISSCGYTADLFKKEYLKIQQKNGEETKLLVQENIKTAQKLIKRVLAEYSIKKTVTPEDKKIISMYTNALAKCTPSISVGSLSFSYTKGLSAEEVVHEFKRLKTITESSFDRRGVPELGAGRPGSLSQSSE